jgi:hypothetical protein
VTQRLLHVLASPDQVAKLSETLQKDGFGVDRGLGGLYVRVRSDTGDESRVEALVHWTSPQAIFDLPVSPAVNEVGYRAGQ